MTLSEKHESSEPKGLDADSRKLVLDTVRQLRKKLLTKENILEWDKHDVFPEDAIRKLLDPEIGLQLLFIPEEYGGIGGGAQDSCAVTREMAKICSRQQHPICHKDCQFLEPLVASTAAGVGTILEWLHKQSVDEGPPPQTSCPPLPSNH